MSVKVERLRKNNKRDKNRETQTDRKKEKERLREKNERDKDREKQTDKKRERKRD